MPKWNSSSPLQTYFSYILSSHGCVPHAQKDPEFGFTICYCHLEILSDSWRRPPQVTRSALPLPEWPCHHPCHWHQPTTWGLSWILPSFTSTSSHALWRPGFYTKQRLILVECLLPLFKELISTHPLITNWDAYIPEILIDAPVWHWASSRPSTYMCLSLHLPFGPCINIWSLFPQMTLIPKMADFFLFISSSSSVLGTQKKCF